MMIHLVYIWPTNETIPPNGVGGHNCTLDSLYYPTGVVIDSYRNIYIASDACNWITKWTPNGTTSMIIAGLNTGDLSAPYGIALDEANGHLYVAERYNARIKRFSFEITSTGVIVAGGHSNGNAPTQLNQPFAICVSKKHGSLYIVDHLNNRIQKWAKNATHGITVLGSPSGTMGVTPFLLNHPYSIALDNEEEYLYVLDGWNNRIQRIQIT